MDSRLLILGAAALGVAYLLYRGSGPPGAPAFVDVPPTAPDGSPFSGAGVNGPPATSLPPAWRKAQTFAGAVAGKVGTAIGTKYLGPLGKVVGANASTDTRANVAVLYNQIGGAQDIVRGNVGTGVKKIASAAVSGAVQPVKTLYHDVTSWL